MSDLETALEKAKKLTEGYPEAIQQAAFIEAFRALYYGQPAEKFVTKEFAGQKKRGRKTGKKGKQITPKLKQFISNGFFKEKRNISQIIERFAQIGIILEPQNLTKQLSTLTQSGDLHRVKEEKGKRHVWLYFEPKVE